MRLFESEKLWDSSESDPIDQTPLTRSNLSIERIAFKKLQHIWLPIHKEGT